MLDADRDPYLSNYDALRRLARDIVRDEHEADDVMQDVWLASDEARGVRTGPPGCASSRVVSPCVRGRAGLAGGR